MQVTTVLSDLIKYNTGYLAKHLNHIDRSRLFIRPDGYHNPMIWILGHIVVSRGSLLEVLGVEHGVEGLNRYFASGSYPLNDPSEYPHFDQIMGYLGKLGNTLVQQIAEGGDNLLQRQAWGDYENIGKYITNAYIHETYHVGQINYLLSLTAGMQSMKSKLSIGSGTRKKKNNTGTTGVFSLSGLRSILTVR